MIAAKKKHIFLSCLLLFFVFAAPAQSFRSDNSIELGATMPLQFVYNNPDELLQAKIVNNAVSLQLNTPQTPGNVYASIVFTSVQAATSYAQSIFLRPCGMSNEITLSQSPTLLFSQGLSHAAPHAYMYDIGLHPFINFVSPGSSVFSIIFTLTQP